MIYRCIDCVNRENCPENQKEYMALCDEIDNILKFDCKGGKFHCYFSLNLKCDYFVEDNINLTGECANESIL
jgi:hypothetical protein